MNSDTEQTVLNMLVFRLNKAYEDLDQLRVEFQMLQEREAQQHYDLTKRYEASEANLACTRLTLATDARATQKLKEELESVKEKLSSSRREAYDLGFVAGREYESLGALEAMHRVGEFEDRMERAVNAKQ